MADAVLITDIGQYVVAETLRQIRNGQVKLKKMCIETEPELEVRFSAKIVIPGGLNAINRASTTDSTQTTVAGEQITTDRGTTVQKNNDTSVEKPNLTDTGTQESTETQQSTDKSTKSFGRSNVVAIQYEE